MLKCKYSSAGSEAKYGPCKLGQILQKYLEQSEEPTTKMYNDTHLGVDVKVAKSTPGRMPVDAVLDGTLVRDGEDHFLFTEKILDKKVCRIPITWKGDAVNVHDEGNGVTYATLRRPRFSKDFTFKEFCLAAADELLTIARLLKK